MELKEIIVDWQVQGSPGGLNIMYFQGMEGSEVISRSAVGAFLDNIQNLLAATTTATVRTTGRIIDDVTGTLVGEWSDPTPFDATGIGILPPISNSAAALIRFTTGQIVDGRLLKGRAFIPGLSADATGGGELKEATQTSLAAASALLLPDSGLRIWSRPRAANTASTPPVTARPGSSAEVTGTSAWNELAVMRSRR